MSMEGQRQEVSADTEAEIENEVMPEVAEASDAAEEAVTEDLPEAANDDGSEEAVAEDAADAEGEVETSAEEDDDNDEALEEGEAEEVAAEEEVVDYELDEEHVRMAEALLFAAAEPLDNKTMIDRMPEGVHIPTIMDAVEKRYEGRGVVLMRIAGKYAFRTSPDLSFMMEKERVEQRRLSRAAIETLAIIAYHQPVTRAEIEEIRGVSVSKGTIDVLMEIGWVKLRGRRRVPGRPVTYGTSEDFLDEFGLDTVKDLPGFEELKAAGLLDARLPPGFSVPQPDDALPEEEEEDDEQDDLFGGDIATPFDEGDEV